MKRAWVLLVLLPVAARAADRVVTLTNGGQTLAGSKTWTNDATFDGGVTIDGGLTVVNGPATVQGYTVCTVGNCAPSQACGSWPGGTQHPAGLGPLLHFNLPYAATPLGITADVILQGDAGVADGGIWILGLTTTDGGAPCGATSVGWDWPYGVERNISCSAYPMGPGDIKLLFSFGGTSGVTTPAFTACLQYQ